MSIQVISNDFLELRFNISKLSDKILIDEIKRRFNYVVIENKKNYEFNNDVWGLIKSFMGIYDLHTQFRTLIFLRLFLPFHYPLFVNSFLIHILYHL